VYKGRYNNDQIAVKFLIPDSTSDLSLVYFAREIQIISTLKSPHVHLEEFERFNYHFRFVVDFVAADPLNLFLVMKFMEEGNLDEYLHPPQKRVIPWDQKLAIASQIATGLRFLHTNKVLLLIKVREKSILT
jgi:serine/threonine protein kinase